MHNPASVLKNDTYELLWDFEIQTGHVIFVRRTEQKLHSRKKKNFQIVDFAISANHRIKLNESEEKDQYLDPAYGI